MIARLYYTCNWAEWCSYRMVTDALNLVRPAIEWMNEERFFKSFIDSCRTLPSWLPVESFCCVKRRLSLLIPQGDDVNATSSNRLKQMFWINTWQCEFPWKSSHKDQMYIYMRVFIFICLYIPGIDICIDMYNNRSLFFRVIFEVRQELVSPSLCFTKQVEVHPRELE